ncbi:hypothetical protein ACVIHH_000202 [Bradyrhizobium sp. USDA 4518]
MPRARTDVTTEEPARFGIPPLSRLCYTSVDPLLEPKQSLEPKLGY